MQWRFPPGCEGKRVKGKPGTLGATYLATIYERSSGYEKKESFRTDVQDASMAILFQPDRSDAFWLNSPKSTTTTTIQRQEGENVYLINRRQNGGRHSNHLDMGTGKEQRRYLGRRRPYGSESSRAVDTIFSV